MNLLVTGGLGLIGHNVVSRLEKLGHTVVIADTRTDYGIIPQAELAYLLNERFKKINRAVVYGACITSDTINYLCDRYKFDAIIHMASFPRQKVVNANPQLGSKTMSQGLLNLLEASVKHQVKRFLYISSSMVY